MIILIVAVVALIVVGIYHYFPLIQVIGDSMYPTYKEGEILLGTRLYKKSNLKAGDVVLFRCSYDNNRIVIKRIDHIVTVNKEPKLFYFLGDNPEHSYDSRHYGYVSSKNLVCKVINQRRKREQCM